MDSPVKPTTMNKILHDLKTAHWSQDGNEGLIMKGLAYVIELLENKRVSDLQSAQGGGLSQTEREQPTPPIKESDGREEGSMCPICQGAGKITKEIFTPFGFEDLEYNCPRCKGTGRDTSIQFHPDPAPQTEESSEDDFAKKHLAVIRGQTAAYQGQSIFYILMKVFPDIPEWKLYKMVEAYNAKGDDPKYPELVELGELRDANATLTAEITALKEWKRSALEHTPDWHAVAKELNMKLGVSVSHELLPAIKALKEQVEVLEARRKNSQELAEYRGRELTRANQNLRTVTEENDRLITTITTLRKQLEDTGEGKKLGQVSTGPRVDTNARISDNKGVGK